MNILVLGGRSFVALELVRNFGQHGHTVYTAESLPVHPAGWSRHTRKNFRVSSPRFATDAFLQDIRRIIEECAIEFLVPTCEETYYIAQYAPSLRRTYPNLRIASGSIENIRQLHDKLLCMELCRELGVTSPQTLLVRTHEDLYLARKAFGNRRMIMKPRFSRFGTKIHILSPRDDLHAIDIAGREWICQEYIEGPLLCSYSYAKAGVVVATVCYQDLLNKSGEASSVFIPVMNDQVNTTIATIVRYLRYSGSISFDFIVKDNVPYLIECNPRITSGVHCIANSDLYEIMYNNGQLDAPTAKKQIRFATIIRHRAWLRSVPDVSFSARDLLPTASYAWLIFQFLLVARRTNITFIEATTHDIEWNGDTI